MVEPTIIGFYGFSNTGKTTVITQIISQLTKRGYKICSVKQTTHSYSIDNPGKDTWKHAKAGAELVCFQTAIETSFVIKKQVTMDRIIKIISTIDSYDIILIEGAHESSIPKIRINKNTPIRENTVFTFNGDIFKVITLIEHQLDEKE